MSDNPEVTDKYPSLVILGYIYSVTGEPLTPTCHVVHTHSLSVSALVIVGSCQGGSASRDYLESMRPSVSGIGCCLQLYMSAVCSLIRRRLSPKSLFNGCSYQVYENFYRPSSLLFIRMVRRKYIASGSFRYLTLTHTGCLTM